MILTCHRAATTTTVTANLGGLICCRNAAATLARVSLSLCPFHRHKRLVHEEKIAALRKAVDKAKGKVLAYDEQLVRNFIEEIKVFPDRLTITVRDGAKEDIAI